MHLSQTRNKSPIAQTKEPEGKHSENKTEMFYPAPQSKDIASAKPKQHRRGNVLKLELDLS